MIEVVDEALRDFLSKELTKLFPDGPIQGPSQITFFPPSSVEEKSHDAATLNLFLHDLHENVEMRTEAFQPVPGRVMAGFKRTPVHVNLSYLLTVHTKGDTVLEHRLLSQVISVLFRNDALPDDYLSKEAGGPSRVRLQAAQPNHPAHVNPTALWQGVGGHVRAAVGLTAIATFDPFESKLTRVVRELVIGLAQGASPGDPRRPVELQSVQVSAAGMVLHRRLAEEPTSNGKDGDIPTRGPAANRDAHGMEEKQGKGSVESKDEPGADLPLAGVLVRVDGGEEQTLTDDRGFFHLINLRPGPRTLILQKNGFKEQPVQVIVPIPGQPDRLMPVVVRMEEAGPKEHAEQAGADLAASLDRPGLVEHGRAYHVSLSSKLTYTDNRPAAYLPVRLGSQRTLTDGSGICHFFDVDPGAGLILTAEVPGRGDVPVTLEDGTAQIALKEGPPAEANQPS